MDKIPNAVLAYEIARLVKYGDIVHNQKNMLQYLQASNQLTKSIGEQKAKELITIHIKHLNESQKRDEALPVDRKARGLFKS